MKVSSEDFRDRQGMVYPDNAFEVFDCVSSKSIPLLEFLKGKPWDALALAYVHGLRPSCIRVSEDAVTLDAWRNRITVMVDEDNLITSISMEVEVGLPDGVAHGEALGHALTWGLDSEQVRWHQDAESYLYDGINGIYYKRTKDGMVPFPETED